MRDSDGDGNCDIHPHRKIKPVVYVAGPYRGATPNDIYNNINAARSVAVEVWKAGFVALCPHLNSMFMDGIFSANPKEDSNVFLDGAIQLLSKCDALITVGDKSYWEKSKGTLREIEFAKVNNIPVFHSTDELTINFLELIQ